MAQGGSQALLLHAGEQHGLQLTVAGGGHHDAGEEVGQDGVEEGQVGGEELGEVGVPAGTDERRGGGPVGGSANRSGVVESFKLKRLKRS